MRRDYLLERFGFGEDSTLGRLYEWTLNGTGLSEHVPLCWTLEDERRIHKVRGETCIPEGTYQIKLRTEGGMHPRYAARFPWHEGMLWLQDVPGFSFIYIHVGNDDDDTEGCLLVGAAPAMSENGEFAVGRSVEAYTLLYQQMADQLRSGDEVWISISNREPE